LIQEEINRGDEAERLLSNPIFKDSFKAVKDSLVNAMSESPMGDEKTHNRLVIALQLLGQIEKAIKTQVNTGKMAKIQIQGGALHKIVGIA
jgi:hypothetical protein